MALWVARTSTRAGTTIPAIVTVDNKTGRRIEISGCTGVIYEILVGNSKVPNSPIIPSVLRVSKIGPGVHVFRTKVQTTYQECGSLDTPRCGNPPRMSPLPAGTYHAGDLAGRDSPSPLAWTADHYSHGLMSRRRSIGSSPRPFERGGTAYARKNLCALVELGLAAAILSGCGITLVTRTSHPARKGEVVGRFMISPPMGPNYPTSGTITLEALGSPHPSVTIQVGASGRYSTQVPPGTWVVTGRSPKYGNGLYVCGSAGPVTVVANHRVSVLVECAEK